uniref:Uncharacterized protein n=1 Tax=Oryza nivara TaxID=4536 RepID=A0A0E0HM90_ORYNI
MRYGYQGKTTERVDPKEGNQIQDGSRPLWNLVVGGGVEVEILDRFKTGRNLKERTTILPVVQIAAEEKQRRTWGMGHKN